MCCNAPDPISPEEPRSSFPIKEVEKKSKDDNKSKASANKTHKVGVPEITTGITEAKPEITKSIKIPAGADKSLTNAGLVLGRAAVDSIQSNKKSKISKENQKGINADSIQQLSKKVQESLIQQLLYQPQEIQKFILKGLSIEELISLEIALLSSKLDECNKLATFVRNVRYQVILNEILVDHPTWKGPVAAWKDVSVEDKVWLVRLYELYQANVDIPQITNLHPKFYFDPSRIEAVNPALDSRKRLEINHARQSFAYKCSLIPFEMTPQLLKKRYEIEKRLNELTELKFFGLEFVSLDDIKFLQYLNRTCIHDQKNLKALPKLEILDFRDTKLGSKVITELINIEQKLKTCRLVVDENTKNSLELNRVNLLLVEMFTLSKKLDDSR